MKCFLVYSTVIVHVLAYSTALGAEADPRTEEIDSLLRSGEYERAAAHIAHALSESGQNGSLLLRMSEVERKRGNLRGAFTYFSRCIGTLPTEPTSELTDPEAERTLDIAALLRVHNALPVASSIIEALGESRPGYSSPIYEAANLYLVEQRFSEFFKTYYAAYQINPGNVRALPGLAAIRSIARPGAPTKGEFPWLAAAAAFYDNPKIW